MNILPHFPMLDNTVRVLPRVYATGVRYHWVHRRHAASEGWSDQSFATEFQALVAAAIIARCSKARIHATAAQKAQLITYWRTRGEGYFINGLGRHVCNNVYERQGFDQSRAEMQAQFEEAEIKPGLDYVPMTVTLAEVA